MEMVEKFAWDEKLNNYQLNHLYFIILILVGKINCSGSRRPFIRSNKQSQPKNEAQAHWKHPNNEGLHLSDIMLPIEEHYHFSLSDLMSLTENQERLAMQQKISNASF